MPGIVTREAVTATRDSIVNTHRETIYKGTEYANNIALSATASRVEDRCSNVCGKIKIKKEEEGRPGPCEYAG